MAERRVVVPDGMLKAAVPCYLPDRQLVHSILEAALLWLSENPIVPTSEQLHSIIGKLPMAMCDIVWTERDRALIAEWQRRMFLAPEPEVPEEIKDLLSNPEQFDPHPFFGGKIGLHEVVEAIAVEAFRRGKASR